MVALLVEHDGRMQKFIWRLLNTNRFTVLTADDGISALEASRDHGGVIDLLLSDVEIPRMGGLELCKQIRVARPGIKVLMMSYEVRGREQAYMSGLPFVQKPLRLSVLCKSIETLLGPISTRGGDEHEISTLA
jgi:DNA-binding response OmpR family regulator